MCKSYFITHHYHKPHHYYFLNDRPDAVSFCTCRSCTGEQGLAGESGAGRQLPEGVPVGR